MAHATSQRTSGLPSTDYYAPDFRIEVEGRDLDPTSVRDMLEVKAVFDKENLASFSFTVNNWDDEAFDFKYSDTRLFDLGNRVVVRMGYADRLKFMVRGQITKLMPRFPESGASTIQVSGQGGMLRLRDSKPKKGQVKKFVKMTDWEIAQVIAGRHSLTAKVTKEGEVHDLVIQKNQDDAQFLLERAKRLDFECYVQTDPDTGKDELFFIKPTDLRDGSPARVYVFEWGKSLINFTPELSISRQVGSVTVRGWDTKSKKPITYTASPDDLPGIKGQLSGPKAAQERLGDKAEILVDAPVTSDQEARRYAISLLRERSYEFSKASGQVIGLPELRPGDNVELIGLGKRFSGSYYVTKTEHAIGGSGFQTRFEVRRPFDGGTKE